MTINVVCRKDAINRNHLAPLALVFTHDRRRKFVGLGISVALEHWDFEKQQPTTDCPDGAEIQFQITSKIREYEKKIKKLEVLEIPVTFDNLFELDLSDRDFYTQLAKDIFLFSYFMAGINFKDIALLTYGDIDNGRIYYARRKTGKMMNCCLTEQAQEIIDKYHTDQMEEDYIFPILDRNVHTTEKQILERVKKTLKHINKRLHELSEKIGLHTPLTTYVARHIISSYSLKTKNLQRFSA